MKKLLILILPLCLCLVCRPKPNKIQKIIEDGVEVTLNNLEPYEIKGEPSVLTIDKLFIMDFENPDFSEIGIPDVAGFEVDSKRNIYIWSYEGPEYYIFKFNEAGEYMSSFGRRGQGPGELEDPEYLKINENDEIIVSNNYGRMFIFLDTDGNFLKKMPQARTTIYPTFLENEKILTVRKYPINTEGMAECPIVICNTEFEDIAFLHPGFEVPNWLRAKKINGLRTVIWNFPPWCVSHGLIYIGNQVNGYEFLVFDFDGNLKKKIRKKYNPVTVPSSLKKIVLKMFEGYRLNKQYNVKEKVYFPEFMPPFQYFFGDDEGRLFVMTNEAEKEISGFKYDIFNPDGILIGRTSLDNTGNINGGIWGGPFEVKVKNDYLYYLRGKDSGYKELVVCKMIWKKL